MWRNVLYALIATTGTWVVTAFGAATVIFFNKTNRRVLNILLGFAAGVMIAASFWSLLAPAVDIISQQGRTPYIIVTGGFLAGAVFILLSDKAVSMAKKRSDNAVCANAAVNRVTMLVLSITMHNIPEGLAVGVAFGALTGNNFTPEKLMGAISVAVGIALQNFPEGAAVSLPLRREGYSRGKSFFIGQASGIVEPIAGIIGAAAVTFVSRLLPFALSFAAGAMIAVSVHELIPECQTGRKQKPYSATSGIIAGFSVMTLLDIMLG